MLPYGDIDIVDEDEEPDVFVPYDITSYPSDLSLQVLYDQFKSGDVSIPKFQRGFVWSMRQSSMLIESFLVGLPVPPVFFYVDDQNRNIVIDGQQRIRSIVDFFDGSFGQEDNRGRKRVFRLEGLAAKAPYAKKSFDDLDESSKRKLRNSVLRAMNIRQLSPDDSGTIVFHIFERLNSGGTPLSPQEIRNCVFHGPIVENLANLNKLPSWRKLIGMENLDKRGKDIEIIARILGLCLGWRKFERPMKEFINKTMRRYRDKSDVLDSFGRDFEQTCVALLESLGGKPFRTRGPLNVAVLDAVFAAVIDLRGELPADFKQRYERLILDGDFDKAVSRSTADTAFVKLRIKKAIAYLT